MLPSAFNDLDDRDQFVAGHQQCKQESLPPFQESTLQQVLLAKAKQGSDGPNQGRELPQPQGTPRPEGLSIP